MLILCRVTVRVRDMVWLALGVVIRFVMDMLKVRVWLALGIRLGLLIQLKLWIRLELGIRVKLCFG